MDKRTLKYIFSRITELKKRARMEKKLIYSNIYFLYNEDLQHEEYDCIETEKSIVFSKKDEYEVNRGYFISFQQQDLVECLKDLPSGIIIDYNCRGENDFDFVFQNGGLQLIATYVRRSIDLKKEGYEYKSAFSDILEQYYSEDEIEYADMSDIDTIIELMSNKFDKEKDHLPTRKELQEWISKKWVLLFKKDNVIYSLYIYQIIGKKMYSAFSYNGVTADKLYCLEKKGFLDAINNNNIVSKYAWMNMENVKAFKRTVYQSENIKNYIYKKVEERD